MEKRVCERIPVNMDVKICCCNRVHSGILKNLSEKGMFIGMHEMCLPFEPQFTILVPLKDETLNVPVNLIRIDMSPDSEDGIGVEIKNPSADYSRLLDNIRSPM